MPIYQKPDDPKDDISEDEMLHEQDTQNPPVNAEDKNWKDRYGHLRSHTQRQLNEANERVKSLERQLQDSTKKSIALPTSPEQVKDWANKYPDVAKIVETLIMMKTSEQNEEIEKRFENIREQEEKNSREKAQLKLATVHSDFFDDIRHREDFHEWLASKSKRIQDAIYGDAYDADAAIDVINMYKLENAGSKRKKPTDTRDAARNIETRTVNRIDTNNEPHFTESQIAKMTTAEYAKNEEAIDKAIANGRVEYDLQAAR